MQKDRQFRVSGDWALASDGMQWMIQRRKGDGDVWVSVKFIDSTKEWLAYRLKQLAPPADADRLLEGLPDTFDEFGLPMTDSPLRSIKPLTSEAEKS
jgi:hypothetical protein